MSIQNIYKAFEASNGVCTDTRKIEKNQIFFALQGDNFDGNDYVDKALSLGASHVVCSDSKWNDHPKILVVQDTLDALQQVATYHRSQFDIPVIGLTGSNGKTTTKELIAAVLSKKYNVTATIGNLNNHIGVPLTLLKINEATEIAIIEMGANHQKEIAFLSEIARPNYGLITNFGKAHLEGFGGVEGVKKGKSELYDFLANNNGKSFVLHNQKELQERSSSTEQILTSPEIALVENTKTVAFEYNNQKVVSQLTGEYNFNNMLYAIVVGEYFKVEKEAIANAIQGYTPTNHRSQIIEKDNYTIVLDAYNANPSSIEAALQNLNSFDDYTTKWAILGDMFEMGEYAHQEHQRINDIAADLKINAILLGENFCGIESKFPQYRNFEAFKDEFEKFDFANGVILIKGSRGMKLERVLSLL